MKHGKSRTTDAVEIIDHLVGDDAELRQMIAEETVNAQVACVIYDAGTQWLHRPKDCIDG